MQNLTRKPRTPVRTEYFRKAAAFDKLIRMAQEEPGVLAKAFQDVADGKALWQKVIWALETDILGSK